MPPSHPEAPSRAAEALAQVLRDLRAARGWTLAEVSSRTGLAVSSLSKIENGRMSLTFETLRRLADGLGVDLAELFGAVEGSHEQVGGRRSITRSEEGHVVASDNYLHRYLAADLLHKRVIPVVSEVLARTLDQHGPLSQHAVDEFSIVLEGAVMLHTDLYAPVLLNAGDSAYLDANMRHAYLAMAEGPCRVLSVTATSDLRRHGLSDPADAAQGVKLYSP